MSKLIGTGEPRCFDADKADEIRKNAEEHTAEDFPLPEIAADEVEEEPMEENLNEARLDYGEQLRKMQQLEAGTRGFNAGSASLEKILFNYDICISNNLPRARKVMEDALRLHGWDSYIKPTKII